MNKIISNEASDAKYMEEFMCKMHAHSDHEFPDREKWMLAQTLIGAIRVCNAPFCSDNITDNAQVDKDPEYVREVAALIASEVSHMMLEDAIQVLETALSLKRAS